MPNIPSIKIGNTTYNVKDTTAREHLVEVSTTQPSSPDNRLWIKDAGNEYEIPTYDEFTDLKSALEYYAVGGEEEYSTFIQGNRSTTAPNTVTSRNDRCTTGKLFHLYAGDVVNVTGIASGHKFVLASSTGYDSNWQTSDFSYTVTTEMYIFGNEAALNGSDAISPSSITTEITIIDNASRISKNEVAVQENKNAIAQANIISYSGKLISNAGYYIKNAQAVGSVCDIYDYSYNTNYACVIAEHIAKGQGFLITGQVTGTGKLYAWLDKDHKVISNSGSTVSVTNALIECPDDDCTLVVDANTVDVALSVIATPRGLQEPHCYFASGIYPVFERINRNSNTKWIIQFPNAQFRIYTNNGLYYQTSSYVNSIFTVEALKKLVFDKNTKIISVVNATAVSSDYITLFSNDGESYSGLFAEYCNLQTDWAIVQDQYDILSLLKNKTEAFIFFSDIHGGAKNLSRIINKSASWSNHISAIINGGDTVQAIITESLTWYNDLVSSSPVDVLTCIGNHDTWTNHSTWEKASQADVYAAEIAPVVENVDDIVQPEGASTNGLCYYYKDYSSIRVIVLDAMKTDDSVVGYWDNDENLWLQEVLADAKENSKSVVIVAHPPFKKSIAIRDNDSNVNSWMDYRTGGWADGIHVPEAAMDSVQSFINGGGKFICWLSGHMHVDSLLTATGYTGQVMINIASAKYTNHADGTTDYLTTDSCEKWFDCFDIIGIDTTNKMIKVYRVGYDEDASMRMRRRFCYDYANMKLMTVS